MWPVFKKRSGPYGYGHTGRCAVQLRLASAMFSEEYIRTKAWTNARLDFCPCGRRKGCVLHRHTPYKRSPKGAMVARWYGRTCHKTFGLLPDCLPSRFGGTLPRIEQVVAQREEHGLEKAADMVRPNIGTAVSLDSAKRWLIRRTKLVHAGLRALIGLLPELFRGAEPTVSGVRRHLSLAEALVPLRGMAREHLSLLPPPLGFGPRPQRRRRPPKPFQQYTGTDPPRKSP